MNGVISNTSKIDYNRKMNTEKINKSALRETQVALIRFFLIKLNWPQSVTRKVSRVSTVFQLCEHTAERGPTLTSGELKLLIEEYLSVTFLLVMNAGS